MDIQSLIDLKKNPSVAEFRPGDTVKVHARVVEGERERVQMFEGVVIRIRRGGVNSNFTVRRVSHGVGVERTFPFYSPVLEKVDLLRTGKVRRSRLYYLRELRGKAGRIKAGRHQAAPETIVAPDPEPEAEVSVEETEALDDANPQGDDLKVEDVATEEATSKGEAEEVPEVKAEVDASPGDQAEKEAN